MLQTKIQLSVLLHYQFRKTMCILLEHLTIENYPIYEPEVEKSESPEVRSPHSSAPLIVS